MRINEVPFDRLREIEERIDEVERQVGRTDRGRLIKKLDLASEDLKRVSSVAGEALQGRLIALYGMTLAGRVEPLEVDQEAMEYCFELAELAYLKKRDQMPQWAQALGPDVLIRMAYEHAGNMTDPPPADEFFEGLEAVREVERRGD